jgi:uncharacterized membrane protein
VLRAVERSSAGVQDWIGTAIGIAIAVAVGLFFFQGTLRIPLQRFFKATSVILMVVAFQLALTGVHELSESMWIPSSKLEMSTIGPIVRNEVFFFVLILGAAALVVLREWFSAKQPLAEEAANPAARRMREFEFHRQRRWSFAAAILCIAVVISFAGDYVYGRVAAAPSPAHTLIAQDNLVRVPLSDLTDSSLHFYTAHVDGSVIRFLVIHKLNGDYAVALDACQICGTAGYRQEGQSVICRNCGAAIYIPSIGQSGGCNPISVKSRVQDPLLTHVRPPARRILRAQSAAKAADRRGAGDWHGRRHRYAHDCTGSGRPPGARIPQPGRESAGHAGVGHVAGGNRWRGLSAGG